MPARTVAGKELRPKQHIVKSGNGIGWDELYAPIVTWTMGDIKSGSKGKTFKTLF